MTKSKRSEIKQRRTQRRQRERQMVFLVVAGAVLLLIAIIVGSSLIQKGQPIAAITPITPIERPNAQGTAMGNPDAPVRIDVFEDFQCPACQFYTQNVEPQVMTELVATGQVYYVFRQYPFLDDSSATQESDQAANASLCAADQGRFWDYHDMLYTNWDGENQGSFNDRRLVAFAEELKLEMDSFNKCFKANSHKSQISQDLQDAIRMGISGTPSLFVNGKIVAPQQVPTFEEIKAAVDAALASAGN